MANRGVTIFKIVLEEYSMHARYAHLSTLGQFHNVIHAEVGAHGMAWNSHT